MKRKNHGPRRDATTAADAAHLDALREIGNIAAAHAATALSQLVGETILLEVTDCCVLPVEQLRGALPGETREVAAVYVFVNRGKNGSILVVFSHDASIRLADDLLGRPRGAEPELTDDQRAALMEIGNICACAYLNAMAKFLGIQLVPSPPALAVDMLGAILQLPASVVGRTRRYAVVVKTQFTRRGEAITGSILFFPNPRSQALILSAFGLESS